MKSLILIFIICWCGFRASAQDANNPVSSTTPAADSVAPHKPKWWQVWEVMKNPPKPAAKGKVYAFLVPVIVVNPTVAFQYGIGGAASWFMGDPKNTRISSGIATISYTIKKQMVNSAKTSIYTSHDRWLFNGDWRFYITSQPGFALGTGPQSNVLASNGVRFNDNPYTKQDPDVHKLNFDYLRIYETALLKVIDRLYVGIGYHLDYNFKIKDGMLNLNDTMPVTTNFYNYNVQHGFNQTWSLTSGVSIDAVYDTRDNQNNPYHGRYANISFRYDPTFLGSNKNSTVLWLEYRDYINFTPKNNYNILAFWGTGQFVTSGALPFLDLPTIVYDQFSKSGDGYIRGRFRGESLIFAQTEFRRRLFGIKNFPDFFGLAVFANMNTAGANETNIHLFQYVDPAFGAGIRIKVTRVTRTNLAINYAFGFYGSQGLYFRLNETF